MVDAALSRTDIDVDLSNNLAVYTNALATQRKREREAALAAAEEEEQHHHHSMDTLLEVDQNGNPMKRVRTTAAEELYLAGAPEELAWQSQVRKDRSIASYYRRLSINNEIRFQMEMLARENVGEAMKRNLKAKMNILLLKKVEDRYDDL
jgi:hypothetical protein